MPSLDQILNDRYRLNNYYKNALVLLKEKQSYKQYQQTVKKMFLNDYMSQKPRRKFFLTSSWLDIYHLIDYWTDLMIEKGVIEEVLEYWKSNMREYEKCSKPQIHEVDPMLKTSGMDDICWLLLNFKDVK